MAQEVLDTASCLMLVKEAIPDQVFTPKFRANCSCVAKDTFNIKMFNSLQKTKTLEKAQKFILLRAGGKIRMEKFQ